jgi:hypothetical protein
MQPSDDNKMTVQSSCWKVDTSAESSEQMPLRVINMALMNSISIRPIAVPTLLTYLLMELRASWEAANCAATQELPSVLYNLKVHYRLHKSPPLVPILSQIDPIPTIPSYLSKILESTHITQYNYTYDYIN